MYIERYPNVEDGQRQALKLQASSFKPWPRHLSHFFRGFRVIRVTGAGSGNLDTAPEGGVH